MATTESLMPKPLNRERRATQTSVRFCQNCKERFTAHRNRKTCSPECRGEMISKGQQRAQKERSEATGVSVKECSQMVAFEPSQEYIAEQCRLIREGRLVVGQGWYIFDGVKHGSR